MLLDGLLIVLLWNADAYWMLQQGIVIFLGVLTENIGQFGQAVTLLSWAGCLMFKSQAGQIGHRVADGLPPLRHFFKSSYVQPSLGAMPPRMGPANSLHALAY